MGTSDILKIRKMARTGGDFNLGTLMKHDFIVTIKLFPKYDIFRSYWNKEWPTMTYYNDLQWSTMTYNDLHTMSYNDL